MIQTASLVSAMLCGKMSSAPPPMYAARIKRMGAVTRAMVDMCTPHSV